MIMRVKKYLVLITLLFVGRASLLLGIVTEVQRQEEAVERYDAAMQKIKDPKAQTYTSIKDFEAALVAAIAAQRLNAFTQEIDKARQTDGYTHLFGGTLFTSNRKGLRRELEYTARLSLVPSPEKMSSQIRTWWNEHPKDKERRLTRKEDAQYILQSLAIADAVLAPKGKGLVTEQVFLESLRNLPQNVAALSQSEIDAIEAARIVGGLVAKPSNKVKTGLVGSETIITGIEVDPWLNQYCSNIADRGRTATYNSDFTKKIAFNSCIRFFEKYKHPRACITASDENNKRCQEITRQVLAEEKLNRDEREIKKAQEKQAKKIGKALHSQT
jgi:hypothetical protein